jgi:hypothetical protein
MGVVSFTLRPLYPPPRYPLDRRLGGTQSRYGHYGEKKMSLPGIESPVVKLVSRRYTDWTFPAKNKVMEIMVSNLESRMLRWHGHTERFEEPEIRESEMYSWPLKRKFIFVVYVMTLSICQIIQRPMVTILVYFLEKLGKTTKTLGQNSRCPGRDSSPASPECRSTPTFSVNKTNQHKPSLLQNTEVWEMENGRQISVTRQEEDRKRNK